MLVTKLKFNNGLELEDKTKFFFKFNAKRYERLFHTFWQAQGYDTLTYIIRLI